MLGTEQVLGTQMTETWSLLSLTALLGGRLMEEGRHSMPCALLQGHFLKTGATSTAPATPWTHPCILIILINAPALGPLASIWNSLSSPESSAALQLPRLLVPLP